MEATDTEYEPTDQDIQALREWLKKMPHIPQDYDDTFLAIFVKGCKGSLQRTKSVLEKFNALGLLYPEFYGHLDIFDPTTQELLKETMLFPLPKRLDDGTIIYTISTDFKDTVSKKLNIFELRRYCQMIFYVLSWQNEDPTKFGCIVDMKNLNLGHAKELTPVVVRNIAESSKAFPFRIKYMYFVNVPPALKWTATMVKSVVNKKLADRIHFISSMDPLYELIPKEILPKEYGGNGDDIKTMHRRFMKKIESHRDRLVKESNKMRKLDPLRPKANDLEDTVGTFKVLRVD